MDEQPSQQIHRLRKAGKLAEAWEVGCPAVQDSPNDSYLKGAFFWVCYDYLKEVQGAIKSRADAGSDNYNPDSSEIERINFLLDWVIWLDIPPGGYEYRSLLLTFQKNLDCVPKLALLLFKHSDSLFLDEDKQPYPVEKRESPSLMLKFSRKVAKCWMEHEEARQITVDELCFLFGKTRQEAKDKQHQIWLDYDEAKCLILAGRSEQARNCALAVLRRKQTESWAWGALATTYREEDVDAAITLFSKGLCYADDDVYALRILKGLAPLLADRQFLKEASMCVQRAANCYVDNGWNIKADLEKLMSQQWFDAEVDIALLSVFLTGKSEGAMDFLFRERKQCVAIVLNVHRSGKGFHVYLNRQSRLPVRLSIYSSKKIPSPGDHVQLTLSAEDDSLISAEPCRAETIEDVGHIEGILSVKDSGFGFVEDTFVPKGLIKPELNERVVRVLRFMDFDKTKKRYSWKALKIEAINRL